MSLFDKQGFEKTTTDELAELSGVTKRTLYRYINTKQQLLFDIHDRLLREMQAAVQAFQGSPRDRFAAVVDAHVRMAAERAQEIKVLYEEGKHLNPEQSAEMRRSRSRYERTVEQIFVEGIATGDFLPIDSRLATRVILGAVGEFYRWLNPSGRLSVTEISDHVRTLVFDGISLTHWRPGDTTRTAGPGTSSPGPAEPGKDAAPIDRLVAGAARLFREKGYQATSTDEIARLAGTTKGALFYHAGTNEELLVRIHEQVVALSLQSLADVDSTGVSARSALHHIITSILEVVHMHRDAFAVAMEEVKFLPPELQRAGIESQKGYERRLREVVERGIATGELAVGDVAVAVRTVLGMANSTYRWYEPDGALSPAELAEFYASLVFNGCTVRP